MDDQHPATQEGSEPSEPSEPSGPPEGPRTGVAAVDTVTASIEALHARPVAEHATVFEAAHDALRRALDSNPDTGAATPLEG